LRVGRRGSHWSSVWSEASGERISGGKGEGRRKKERRGRREKGEGRREKGGEGRREREEGREKGEGRREKGERRREMGERLTGEFSSDPCRVHISGLHTQKHAE
jgi:hypothetical protein